MTQSGKSVLTRRQFQKMGLAWGWPPCCLAGCEPRIARPGRAASLSGAESLRAHAAARGLLYGAAVDPALLDVEGVAAGNSTDGYTQLVEMQAGILVAENAMKWKALRPSASGFDFSQADRLMDFATLARQRVRGHNLCWHQELPPGLSRLPPRTTLASFSPSTLKLWRPLSRTDAQLGCGERGS